MAKSLLKLIFFYIIPMAFSMLNCASLNREFLGTAHQSITFIDDNNLLFTYTEQPGRFEFEESSNNLSHKIISNLHADNNSEDSGSREEQSLSQGSSFSNNIVAGTLGQLSARVPGFIFLHSDAVMLLFDFLCSFSSAECSFDQISENCQSIFVSYNRGAEENFIRMDLRFENEDNALFFSQVLQYRFIPMIRSRLIDFTSIFADQQRLGEELQEFSENIQADQIFISECISRIQVSTNSSMATVRIPLCGL